MTTYDLYTQSDASQKKDYNGNDTSYFNTDCKVTLSSEDIAKNVVFTKLKWDSSFIRSSSGKYPVTFTIKVNAYNNTDRKWVEVGSKTVTCNSYSKNDYYGILTEDFIELSEVNNPSSYQIRLSSTVYCWILNGEFNDESNKPNFCGYWNGKKITEMYYKGKKVNEAYWNGKRFF